MSLMPGDPWGEIKRPKSETSPPPSTVSQFHRNSDVDKGGYSHHHTLGTGNTQASPGDHNHNGINSKLIGPTSRRSLIPVWTSSASTINSIGDGTLNLSYIWEGYLFFFELYLTYGNTTSVGAGEWRFRLPSEVLVNNAVTFRPSGVADLSVNSVQYDRMAYVMNYNPNPAIEIRQNSNLSTSISSTVPNTWVSGSSFRATGWFFTSNVIEDTSLF